MSNSTKRYLFFWLYYALGYIFPFAYFLSKWGITKKATSIVLPVIFILFLAIIRLCIAIPGWVATWRPSFTKGIIKSIPVYLLFIVLITLGLTLKYILEQQIKFAFTLYFEVIFVLFGSLCCASIFNALHLKYKEIDLIEKGYVLGVVNK